MKYDFKTYLNRIETGSSKWIDMYNRNPKVSKDVVPMSVADMDFLTPPVINKAICDYVNTQTLGCSRPLDSYLDSVVTFFKEYHGYNSKKEWIFTTPGIVSALANSVTTFTEKGDNVIIFTPVYKPFYDVVANQGRNVIECPLKYENNRYELDFDLLEELALDSKTNLILFCSPHNPGGIVWSKEDLLRIADIVEKNDLIIVSDEIHSDILFNGHKHHVLGGINDTIGQRSIICTAASKTFNIAGLQCSNIFIQNEEIRTKFIANYDSIGIERANILGFAATKAAYSEGLDWLEEVRLVLDENFNMVKEFFGSYGDIFKVMNPEASFTAWVNFENLNVEHEEFLSFLDIEAEFFTTNGLFFGKGGRNFIRINVGLPRHKLQENLDRLKISLKKCYNI